MLVNSSSSEDFPPHLQSSDVSSFLIHMNCYITKPASFIFISTSLSNIFIPLPVVTFVLLCVVQEWRRSTFTSSGVPVSHSDVFTYHMVIIELIGVVSYCLLLSVSLIVDVDFNVLSAGCLLSVFHWYGQSFFHVLTCLERHLAVVHPITYLSLRGERGNRLRNIITVCVWPLCLVGTCLKTIKSFIIVDIFFYTVPLIVVSFCSLSVLCVVRHPGPGQEERAGGPARVDQSKQRAFYTIVAILGTLMLRFMGSLVWKLVFASVISSGCVIMASVSWFGLPSTLVLPLLFLHRKGKLVCCKTND